MANDKRAQKEVDPKEVGQAARDRLAYADALRAAGLTELTSLREAKARSMAKEQERLRKKLGPEHPRVLQMKRKLEANQLTVRGLEMEAEKASIKVPSVDENTWLLHGLVRCKDGKGVAGLTVAPYDRKGEWLRELGYACTDRRGYFSLLQSGEESELRKYQGMVTQAAYIRVTDRKKNVLYAGEQAVPIKAGQVVYREIYLAGDDEVCPPPAESGGGGETPQPDIWTIRGRVEDQDGLGIARARVNVYDKDMQFDDELGEVETDEEGYFQVSYEKEQFQGLFEKKPKIYLKVTGPDGGLLYESEKAVEPVVGREEVFDIKVKSRESRKAKKTRRGRRE